MGNAHQKAIVGMLRERESARDTAEKRVRLIKYHKYRTEYYRNSILEIKKNSHTTQNSFRKHSRDGLRKIKCLRSLKYRSLLISLHKLI